MKTTFGSFIRDKRIEAGLTLRLFCKSLNIDASNWSKIERDMLTPPRSLEVLDQIAKLLNIEVPSEDYHTMKDLAVLSAIPKEIIDEKVLEQLPIFFRTVRGDIPQDEELLTLYNKIKEVWTPES